jgi:cysteine synthase A
VDKAQGVTNAQSIDAMHALSQLLGRRVGPSTGTNFFAVTALADAMLNAGESGSIVSLICDGGERYADTYYNDAWTSALVQ